MRRFIAILISISLVLVLFEGCSISDYRTFQYSKTYLSLFDTVTIVVGVCENEAAFEEYAQSVYDILERYHMLFDIYNDYPGINNLKTVNDCAGMEPVVTDPAIIELLEDCKRYYTLTEGTVNIAMGSVLSLWHNARTYSLANPDKAYIPDASSLEQAALHISIEELVIDHNANTVFIKDPDMRLDVGAIAKGWAAQKAVETLPEGFMLSVGGNICASGPKDEKGTPWIIGIQDPKGDGYLHTIQLEKGSVVTSGDYQRTFRVNDEDYHHIIDPHTLHPSSYWSSVTVICNDSALADALSTALFVLEYEEGLKLLSQCGAQAMWVSTDGKYVYSESFSNLIIS